jgi:hypothetical protein
MKAIRERIGWSSSSKCKFANMALVPALPIEARSDIGILPVGKNTSNAPQAGSLCHLVAT